MSKIIRGFHRLNKAWYAKTDPQPRDEITFGIYNEDGEGCVGEMTVEWIQLTNRGKPAPKLNIFDDAWKILAGIKDVIDELAKYNRKNISEEEFATMLIGLGFKDMTEYETPERYRLPEKRITFIDTEYNELFSIKDGEEIEIENRGTGGWDRITCVYVDDRHFRVIGGALYHVYQFANLMRQQQRQFRLQGE